MVSVKICGFQSAEMVRETAALPVDHIGFVFARSKRQVTAEQVGEWIRNLKELVPGDRPKTVGVFVNPSQEELTAVLQEAPLDVVQLHGQEKAEFCRWIKETFPGIQIFKVFSVAVDESESSLEDSSVKDLRLEERLGPYRSHIDGVLLDTFDPLYGGGSGKTFAWDAIPPYLAWCREAGIPLIVAGGLQPDNVSDLIQVYRPDGVDVSSGVETDGVKDINKIRAFVERVKSFV